MPCLQPFPYNPLLKRKQRERENTPALTFCLLTETRAE